VSDSEVAQRLRLAFEMHDFGVKMQRARWRRLHPEATESEIDAEVSAWLGAYRGSPLGEASWRPSHRFE
jgi:hypothetical protein